MGTVFETSTPASGRCGLRRALLYASILTGGLLLGNEMIVAPAFAAACSAIGTETANGTTCISGVTIATLTYPVSNPTPYTTGNFTLTLDDHDVNVVSDGIDFSGVVNGDGFITLQNGSVVHGNAGFGIKAEAANSNTTIEVRGTSTVTGSDGGIIATSAGGGITINTGVDTSVMGDSLDGIFASANAAGNVTIDALGAVTGNGVGNVDGIYATASSGIVDVTTGTKQIQGADEGIEAGSFGSTVKVTTGTGAVIGLSGSGINALGWTGTTVDAHGDVSGGDAGINAENFDTGAVHVTTNGALGTLVSGTTGAGIIANAVGTGNTDVEVHTAVTGGTIGIDANATTGAVEVTTDVAAVLGKAGHGIDATASGAVTVLTGGNVTGTIGHGVNAQSSAGGNVGVTTSGLPTTTDVVGTTGAGINAGTTGAGTVTIQNYVNVMGSVAGVTATSGGGAILITNDYFIANSDLLDNGLAIQTTIGPTTIDNNGGLRGRVLTGIAGDQVINDGVWYTQGTSDFGGGSDVVNNNGYLVAGNQAGAAETAVFTNLESLNNNNIGIYLQDQIVGQSFLSDRLEISGNYNGNGGRLLVDVFLGGPGSLADVLDIGGNVAGVTEIFVTDINAGSGGYNPDGILVVHADGNTTADNFVLANGPIGKGLFVYDLLFDEPNGDYLLVGLPGQAVFETPAAVASAQEIFRETADAWSTRQENLRDLLAARRTVTAVADPAITVSDAPMGSMWVSALGSWSDRDHDASFSLLDADLDFDLSYSQNISGVVGGADFRTEIGASSSLLFGLMAGYVDSNLDFDEGGTSIDSNGATIGAYAALLSNGFFATVLVKADLLDMDYAAAGDDDKADVTSYGARGDMGFRFGDAGLFVEPMLSIDAISTKIDEFEIAGTEIDAGTNESFRGGAGLRAGFGDEAIRASATARVWDVFSTDNAVDIPGLTVSDDDLEGVYGDVSAQVDVSLSGNTTLYLKGGILFSDDVTKPNASGGFAFSW